VHQDEFELVWTIGCGLLTQEHILLVTRNSFNSFLERENHRHHVLWRVYHYLEVLVLA